MSSSSSCLNSTFGAANFSLSNFRILEAMGCLCVKMWWTTSWLTGGSDFDAQTTVRNSSSRRLQATLACPGPSLLAGPAAWEEEAGPVLAGPALAGQAVWGVEETAPAMSGPVVRASVEVTWADKYGCTKLTTTSQWASWAMPDR